MDMLLVIRWLHVVGACILLGTGAGIAFFMVMAHRTRSPAIIAHTASVVVIADTVFTATAAIVQPITGFILARMVGWSLGEGWILISLILYLVVGVFWLPVLWLQIRLRNLARISHQAGTQLPDKYYRIFNIWIACGIPAFSSILAIIWLMLARPKFVLWSALGPIWLS
jgi:uncharacterized membrane protein